MILRVNRPRRLSGNNSIKLHKTLKIAAYGVSFSYRCTKFPVFAFLELTFYLIFPSHPEVLFVEMDKDANTYSKLFQYCRVLGVF